MTRLPQPLAEGAPTATRHAGTCSICRRDITAFERYALTVPRRQLAHVRCIAAAATRTAAR